MTDDSVRCWLVERTFDDRNLVTLVYATPDGERYNQRELSSNMLDRVDVTAARDVPRDDLEPVEDADTSDRYADEASRMSAGHDPNDAV